MHDQREPFPDGGCPSSGSDAADRYGRIIRNAYDAIVLFSRDGTILEINPRAERLFGYAPDEIIGRPFSVLVPEERREAHEQAWRQYIIAGQAEVVSRVFKGMFLHREGRLLPIELTFSLEPPECGGMVAAFIRDVTDRHLFESELQRHANELEHEVAERTRALTGSEERYRVLIQTAPDAILAVDGQGIVMLCNQKAAELFGYAPEELRGMPIGRLVPGEIQELLHRTHAAPPAAGSPQIESYAVRGDGSAFPAEYTIATIAADGGSQTTLFVRDISSRKGLERELQDYTLRLEEKVRARTYELTASQQNLKEKVAELSILKEVNEALSSAMDLDEVLHIILVGATSHHGFGFNRAFIFLVSDDGEFLEGRVAIGPSDSGEAQRIWIEIVGKNLTLSEILKSYTTQSGRVDTYVNSIIRTIRVPLHQTDNVLARVVAGRESINVRDAHNHPLVPQDLIALMNCNAFALIPLIAEDRVLGVLWADNAITKKTIDDHDMEQLRTFAVNASLAIEKSNLIKSIQAKVEELDRTNRELCDSRDRLIRTEKLAAVGEMSASVAHGLRNPLVSIGGFARRLLKKEPEGSQNRKYLQIIVDEIDRLERILIELLDFVKPRTLRPSAVRIHQLVQNCVEALAADLERYGIHVVCNLHAGDPVLELDEEQIVRVVQTLCRNAVNAMQEGGTLTVGTASEEGMLRLSIADTGAEIPDEDMEKLLHPLHTVRSSTGLGLAVCNQIVALHGGTLKVRHETPRGMAFDVYLPFDRQQPT